jgi:hypothetical protein
LGQSWRIPDDRLAAPRTVGCGRSSAADSPHRACLGGLRDFLVPEGRNSHSRWREPPEPGKTQSRRPGGPTQTPICRPAGPRIHARRPTGGSHRRLGICRPFGPEMYYCRAVSRPCDLHDRR